jgi:hypothetical protein
MAGRQSHTFGKYSVNIFRLRPGIFEGLEQQIQTTSETESAKCVFHVAEVCA